MRVHLRRGRTVALAAALAAVLAAGAACSSNDTEEPADAGGTTGGGPITLTVDTFGTFGYEALYKQYEATHPNIKIKQRNVVRLDDYTPRLQQWLAAGSGAGDVVALEEGILVQFLEQADKFVNLLDFGAGELKANFLDWKWQLGMTSDGKKLIGLGTDVGPLSMAYRVDLFKKAGLPTERDQVSALWPDWNAFYEVAKQYKDKTGKPMVDGANTIYNTVLGVEAGKSTGYTYFDKSNNLVIETNPAIKTAFDYAARMQAEKLTANLPSFSPEWSAAFRQDSFAVLPAPSWMLGIVEGNAGPEGAGKWDVAALPGGGGYWGGSWLAVPAQSKHQKEAADLAAFLTNPESQLSTYLAANTFPSAPKYYKDEAITARVDDYFNNAPVGKIFGDNVSQIKPLYLGPKNQNVRQEIENVLLAVGQGRVKPGDAWQRAVQVAQTAAR